MNERVLMHLSFPRSGQRISIALPKSMTEDPSDRISPEIMKYLSCSSDRDKRAEHDKPSYHD